MAKGTLKHIKLTCPTCGKIAFAILMENEQGLFKVNTYLCADDLTEMVRSFPDADTEQSGDNENVG